MGRGTGAAAGLHRTLYARPRLSKKQWKCVNGKEGARSDLHHDNVSLADKWRAGWWEPEWVRETTWDSVQVRSVCPSWGGGTRCREVGEPQTCSRDQTDRIGHGLVMGTRAWPLGWVRAPCTEMGTTDTGSAFWEDPEPWACQLEESGRQSNTGALGAGGVASGLPSTQVVA